MQKKNFSTERKKPYKQKICFFYARYEFKCLFENLNGIRICLFISLVSFLLMSIVENNVIKFIKCIVVFIGENIYIRRLKIL